MEHQLLAESIRGLKFGLPQSAANLSLLPLCRPQPAGPGAPAYLTLVEALQGDLAEVTEVSEQGSVPNLAFSNKAGLAILLLDGEELAGAKQNRVLNLTILVPAHTRLTIPVSCVERGRWSYRQRRFQASGVALHARARAAKAAAVSESLAAHRSRAANQGALWDEIDRKSAAMCVDSDTAAMADVYAGRARELAELRGRFQPVADQVGAVFAISGGIVGLELFDSPVTFAKYLDKLVDSYSIDALEAPAGGGAVSVTAARRMMDVLCGAEVKQYDAIGLGKDLRLRGPELEGAALSALGRVVHLSAYKVMREQGFDTVA
jgi:hypothetical protein